MAADQGAARRRLRACVEAWPECSAGEYEPRCCRFPKSCSCTAYDDEHVTEADLEPLDYGGKTREQESDESVQMLGLVLLLLVVAVCVAVAVVLWA